MSLSLASFFQLGYVCRDLQKAAARLNQRYGIRNMRFREYPMMAQSHFYVGDVLYELIEPRNEAPQIYFDFLPDNEDGIRLQHHGHILKSEAAWLEINAEIDRLGIATNLRGEILDGQLKYIYADTVADLGYYTEYVYLSGEQKTAYYADVPFNP